MANPKDFRTSQIQTNKIISSGSTGTNAKILIYPIDAELSSSPNTGQINPNAFDTSEIGTDVFLFISGGQGAKDGPNPEITVIGGDLHISGNLSADGAGAADADWTVSGSSLYTTSSLVVGEVKAALDRGKDTFFFVSGSSGSLDTNTQGASVFGGDVLISGCLKVQGDCNIQAAGIIGNAEDGTYSDGLFTDFTNNTPVGTAVDRFNEVLKALAPSPAPSLDDLGSSDTGASGRLSFGTTNGIGGYTNVTGTGSLPAVDINGSYSVTSFSGDLRRGIFNDSTTINGILNDDVAADSPNYPANAFGDGEKGVLFLELNGTEVLSVLLTSTDNAITASTSNSSTLQVSPVGTGSFANGSPFDTFKHRTGVYNITAADQQNGWNVVKVIHQVTSGSPGTNVVTNYVSWVVDDDSTAITATNNSLGSLSMAGSVYLSGVEYNTSGTATYLVDINNAYLNTYSSSGAALSFGGSTNLSISSQAIPSIGGSENEDKVIPVTGSATVTGNKLLNASLTARITVDHPISADELTNGGASTISGILKYNLSGSSSSTVLLEDFRNEGFRLSGSNNFDNQSDVTSAANSWDPTQHREGNDSLIVYNETVTTEPSLANGGDFGGITNGPAGNPDYSTLAGSGSYVRAFQNNTGGSKSNFDLFLTGSSATITTAVGSISGNTILVEIKLPGSSGWNVLLPFGTGPAYGNDGAGVLNGAFDSSINAKNSVTFGANTVANNDYVVIRVTADHAWTGNLSEMEVAWT